MVLISVISLSPPVSLLVSPGLFWSPAIISWSLGTVEAVSLSDIYLRAKDEAPLSDLLRQKEADWERLKKTNSSSFLHLYRYPNSGRLPAELLLKPSIQGNALVWLHMSMAMCYIMKVKGV